MCAQRCHDSTHILLVYLYFQFNCLQMLKHSYFHTRLFVTTVAIKIAEELSELTSLKKYMLLCTKQGVKFLFFPIFSYFSQHTPIFPIF